MQDTYQHTSKYSRPGLRELLLTRGLINEDQLNVALKEKQTQKKLLGELLVDLNLLKSQDLQNLLSQITGYPVANLDLLLPHPEAVRLIPIEICRQYRLLPFQRNDTSIAIAMADPEDVIAQDIVLRHLRLSLESELKVVPYHADFKQIQVAIEKVCTSPQTAVDEEGTIHLVNTIITNAVNEGASDIHFQPEQQMFLVRYRLDGILQTAHTLHKDVFQAINVRIKILGSMDIAESRRPQNGRFSLALLGREIDFRVSSHPTVFGENIVLRILDKAKSLIGLSELGFKPTDVDFLKNLVKLPQGMIILSGPTGAGKTTTLYALLSHMDSKSRNIMTLEEPVEYQIPGIRQTEIREGGVLDYADGVRSILRQDPDVIFIGEIRDEATAKMALRAAMTGHLVISTLHTSDSFGVPGRLIDLGLSPTLLAGNLLCVVAQRLARTLCPPCEDCNHKGFKGRIALVEILKMNEELDQIVATGGNRSSLKQQAHNQGVISLYQDGIEKAQAGKTTLEEVQRTVGIEEN